MSAPAGTDVGIAAALGAATVPRRAVLGGGAALGTGLLAPKGFRPAVAAAEADRAWAKIFPRLPASVRFSFTKTSYPFRQPAFSALVRALGQYGTADYLPKITAPALVTQYQGETAFPGQGAAAERLIRSPATLHEFTAAAGGQFHCAPMAPQRRNQVLFDWLGGVL